MVTSDALQVPKFKTTYLNITAVVVTPWALMTVIAVPSSTLHPASAWDPPCHIAQGVLHLSIQIVMVILAVILITIVS